ncbi:MAG: hypothetical protein U1E39_00325 [Planctomycetota bacterium]
MKIPAKPGALANGVAFGLLFTAFQWGWDAIEGKIAPWPRWALAYGSAMLVASTLWGLFWWWLQRREARRK